MGYDPYGEHRLISGITGEYIDTKIFMGITFYQRLQKFVTDQLYAISHGPSDAMTRQPLEGKALSGGMKLGEMEKDVLCSHGSSRFLGEAFFDHSDGYYVYVCRSCGDYAVVNHTKEEYSCKNCNDMADIYEIPCSWSSKLLFQEIKSMMIGCRFVLDPLTFQK